MESGGSDRDQIVAFWRRGSREGDYLFCMRMGGGSLKSFSIVESRIPCGSSWSVGSICDEVVAGRFPVCAVCVVGYVRWTFRYVPAGALFDCWFWKLVLEMGASAAAAKIKRENIFLRFGLVCGNRFAFNILRFASAMYVAFPLLKNFSESCRKFWFLSQRVQ